MAIRDPREIALERGRPSSRSNITDNNKSVANSRGLGNDGSPPTAAEEPSVFVYPLDMMMEKTDHLSIKIFEQVRSGDIFGFGNVDKLGEKDPFTFGKNDFLRLESFTDKYNRPETQQQLEKNAKFIFLPIPQQVSDALSVSYAEDKLNPLQAAGLKAVAQGIEDPARLLSVGQEITSKLLDGLNSGTVTAIKAALSGKALNAFGANVSSTGLITRATGQVLQSNLELLFSGVTLRSFPFVYDFTPRDPREAETVKGIIRTLKQSMVPSGGKSGSRNALFINSPKVFQLQYRSGNKDHPFLNMFKICALSDLSVNYTASGTYATYGDGSPVHIQVQMTFKEINPIYSEDYDDLSERGYKNVGY